MRSSEILSLDERGSDSKVANRPQQHEDRQARSNEAEIVRSTGHLQQCHIPLTSKRMPRALRAIRRVPSLQRSEYHGCRISF